MSGLLGSDVIPIDDVARIRTISITALISSDWICSFISNKCKSKVWIFSEMSPNHKDHTDLKNKKKSPKGSQCLVHFAFFFALFILKTKQRKSKSNLSFWFRQHWGRGKETAQHKIFFPPKWHTLKYFPTNLAQPWDEGSGWFLTHLTSCVHLYWGGDCCLAPHSPTPRCRAAVPSGSEPAEDAGFAFSQWLQLRG